MEHFAEALALQGRACANGCFADLLQLLDEELLHAFRDFPRFPAALPILVPLPAQAKAKVIDDVAALPLRRLRTLQVPDQRRYLHPCHLVHRSQDVGFALVHEVH